MKIAIFSDTFAPLVNGVSSVVFQSALGLAELGHTIKVFTVSAYNKKELNKITSGKFEVIALPSFKTPIYKGLRATLPVGMSILKVKKFNPDILHSHTPFAVGWEAVWANKMFNTPLVGTHHTFYDYYLKHVKLDYKWTKKPAGKFMVAYYNRCDLVLSPTHSLAEDLKKYKLKSPVEIMPNPVDTEFFKPAADTAVKEKLKSQMGITEKLLVYMGRVSYEKSINQILKAFALGLKKSSGIKLMIVGGGPETAKLKKLSAGLGISEHIIFTGFVFGQELLEKLQAADAFITASVSENMPISILEAMAAGLPIIATRTLGIPEIVKNGENGFLANTNGEEELCEKILELLENDRLLEKFGTASRRCALNYSLPKTCKLLEDVYKKLIGKSR